MHRDGLFELPPPRGGNGNGRWNPQPTPATDPGPPRQHCHLLFKFYHCFCGISTCVLQRNTPRERELVEYKHRLALTLYFTRQTRGGCSCLVLSSVYTGSGRLARIFGLKIRDNPNSGKGLMERNLFQALSHFLRAFPTLQPLLYAGGNSRVYRAIVI
jgi:hypothetical protein